MTRGRPAGKDILTPREWEVLSLIELGLTNEEIAAQLSISPNTIKFHVSEILSKLQVRSGDEAVRVARERRPTQHLWLPWVLPSPVRLRSAAPAALALAMLVLMLGPATLGWRPSTDESDGAPLADVATPVADHAILDFQVPPTPQPPAMSVTFDNPFDYCRAAGNVDQPDPGFVSPGQTPEMVRAIADAEAMPPDAEFRRLPPTLTWRCMEGQVYVCSFGANIQCNAKANLEANPTPAMTQWCQTQPSNLPSGMPAFLPKAVTGRTTVYTWQCLEGRAVPWDEPTAVDARGYMKPFWYLVLESP
jgi:DNA-binding CsgD family transcriptional regulator